jgi:hypothetical protein
VNCNSSAHDGRSDSRYVHLHPAVWNRRHRESKWVRVSWRTEQTKVQKKRIASLNGNWRL